MHTRKGRQFLEFNTDQGRSRLLREARNLLSPNGVRVRRRSSNNWIIIRRGIPLQIYQFKTVRTTLPEVGTGAGLLCEQVGCIGSLSLGYWLHYEEEELEVLDMHTRSRVVSTFKSSLGLVTVLPGSVPDPEVEAVQELELEQKLGSSCLRAMLGQYPLVQQHQMKQLGWKSSRDLIAERFVVLEGWEELSAEFGYKIVPQFEWIEGVLFLAMFGRLLDREWKKISLIVAIGSLGVLFVEELPEMGYSIRRGSITTGGPSGGGEPKNVNEALTDDSWIVAMQEELNQFIANDIWELVPQPRNMTIIGTKWVFRNKLDKNGVVSRNKTRLVAQGYNHQEGINYDETYAPVARLESISM
ncbi:retrovirus-related pol polyprotein from transposon TNT 1-94 [Tanacetum coccineum]|uniref:Retrovirus-related pol polyprotein from transposon TNT 1-94 n=1 Tax=Tanacetum coccineum TaxID=301880 RepID=A0ABQ5JEV6_9ASTR